MEYFNIMEKDNKTEQIGFRSTEEFKFSLEKIAKTLGISVGSYITLMLTPYLKKKRGGL